MALPTLARTYQYSQDTITVQGSTSATARLTILTLKNRLIGFAQAPLTVKSSGNGVTASAADNWSTVSDVQSGTSNYSWFRFGMPEMSANCELLITCRSGTGSINVLHQSMEVLLSPTAGFTGGTAVTRPTATDELALSTPAAWCNTTDVQHQLYVQRSTDGYGLRINCFNNSFNSLFLLADRLESGDPSWTTPIVGVGLKSTTTTQPLLTSLNNTGVMLAKGNTGATMTLYCSAPYHNNNTLMSRITAPFSYTSSYPMPKIRLVSETTANLGDMGVLDDVWWAPTTTATGDTWPNDTTRQFVQLGGIIIPHSGSVVAMT